MSRLSILDLVRVRQGEDARQALEDTRELASQAERLNFTRYWVAEHHNFPSIASAATSLVIQHIAAGTQRIRVGAGGIMLPNHSPLVIAEQFGTLEALFPGRIDLGLGRAPGTDQITWRALRRDYSAAERFPDDVQELQSLLGPARTGMPVRAIPGEGSEVPLWILGSSLFGAKLAAELGLPYAFASHFAPAALIPALEIYRKRFRPSAQLTKPYAMVGVNIVAADTVAEARRLATTTQMGIADFLRGAREFSKPPINDIEGYWSPAEKAGAQQMMERMFIGDQATVKAGLDALVEETGADELMIVSDLYDVKARKRSLEIIAEAGQLLDDPAVLG